MMFSISKFQQEWALREALPEPVCNLRESLPNSPISKYFKEYKREVQNAEEAAHKALEISPLVLAKHRVRLVKPHLDCSDDQIPAALEVRLASLERKGAVATYEVVVGCFSVNVRVLQIDADNSRVNERSIIAKGSFGVVIAESTKVGVIATKQIQFRNNLKLCHQDMQGVDWQVRANFQEMKSVLVEFAVAKICEIFGVGVPLRTPYGFDVLCFRDQVQFSMEMCCRAGGIAGSLTSLSTRMMYCMRVMHLLGLVHKDIKPSNILYSPSLQNFVYCDFGVSQPIAEPLGLTSLSYRQGTPNYMSPDMRNLQIGEYGYIDLYYNDLYCLKRTLKSMYFSTRIRQNQMKFKSTISDCFFEEICLSAFKLSTHDPIESLQYNPYSDTFLKYFPELKSINFSLEDHELFEVKFVLSAVTTVEQLQYYIDLCDRQDERVKFISGRLEANKKTIKNSKEDKNWTSLVMNLSRQQEEDVIARIETTISRFCLSIAKTTRSEECRILLDFMEMMQSEVSSLNPSINACRMMFDLTEENPPAHLLQKISGECASWTLSQLNALQAIADKNNLLELRLNVLQRLSQLTPIQDANFVSVQHNLLQTIEELLGKDSCIEYLRSFLSSFDAFLFPIPVETVLVKIAAEFARRHPSEIAIFIERNLEKIPMGFRSRLLGVLGTCYLIQMNLPKALRALRFAAEITLRQQGQNVSYFSFHNVISSVYNRMGDPDRAVSLLHANIDRCKLHCSEKINSELISSYCALASVVMQKGQFEEAHRCLAKAIKLVKPKTTTTTSKIEIFQVVCYVYDLEFHRTTNLKRLAVLISAVNSLTKNLMEEFLRHPSLFGNEVFKCYHFQGNNFLRLGQYQQAYDSFLAARRSSLSSKNRNRILQMGLAKQLGYCELKLGITSTAVDRIEEIKTLGKCEWKCKEEATFTEFIMWGRITELYIEAGNRSATKEATSQLADLSSDTPHILDTHLVLEVISQRCFAAGWYCETLQVLQALEQVRPQFQSKYYMGVCHERLGNLEQCLRWLQSAASNSDGSLQMRASCYALLAKGYSSRNQTDKLDYCRKQELNCLLGLPSAGCEYTTDHYYRLAVLTSNQQKEESNLYLLKALALTERKGERSQSLIIDCANLWMKRAAYAKALRLWRKCPTMTNEVLLSICKCCIFLGRKKDLVQPATLLLRLGSTVAQGILKKRLMKAGWQLQMQILFRDKLNAETSPSSQIQDIFLAKRTEKYIRLVRCFR